MDPALSRTLWHRLEAINAVAYFAPECREASTRLGLKGFWMGYFATRAAPLGRVAPGVVEATFFGFHGDRVRRALPDAWTFVAPDEVVASRSAAASTALRRLLTDVDAEMLATRALPAARAAIAAADPAGRALFAANRDVPWPHDPVAALWQAATTLREHRGDGHVALLVAAGLDGCEAHLLAGTASDAPPDLYQQSRGWSEEEWRAATARLSGRGVLAGDGTLTAEGRALRHGIEVQTDMLAALPYAAVGSGPVGDLLDALRVPSERIAASGEIHFPNPIGLPPPVIAP